mmetsp:Transcript_23642/g.55965  ORF Transcript_23642/g.55965 Transcript_23642/m.55965 type:complete len:105 (+) Transcript_23642:762-1076(+)
MKTLQPADPKTWSCCLDLCNAYSLVGSVSKPTEMNSASQHQHSIMAAADILISQLHSSQFAFLRITSCSVSATQDAISCSGSLHSFFTRLIRSVRVFLCASDER